MSKPRRRMGRDIKNALVIGLGVCIGIVCSELIVSVVITSMKKAEHKI